MIAGDMMQTMRQSDLSGHQVHERRPSGVRQIALGLSLKAVKNGFCGVGYVLQCSLRLLWRTHRLETP